MKIFEIGTGYTSIPAKMGAATEIVVEELTRAMLSQGVDVNIVDIKDEKRQETDLPIIEVYMPQFFSTGNVVSLGVVHKIKRVLYSISLTMKLHRLIKRLSKEEKVCLHFHNQYNLFFFLKLTPKCLRERVIIGYTVHSYIWFGHWDDIKKTISKRYFQEVYCCQHADRVFVLNEIVSNMLSEHYGVEPTKICNVINGVNTDVYNESKVSTEEIISFKSKYGIDKKIVFQVGSVCDRKNQLGTFELLLPLMKKDERIVFAYAGGIIDKEYALELQEKIKKEGLEKQVVYFGEVAPGKELNILYSASDVCIMNSKSEAFALVIAEALSVPRPIFINEAIMHSLAFLGKNLGNGIFQIDDDFEHNLLQVLNNNHFSEMLKRKGRDFIEREYSWKVAAKMYKDIFAVCSNDETNRKLQ